MARYDTYTRFDDRINEELDRGFIGFNNRLRPDQLTSGILFDSQNGRMAQNGEWQTRKGIDNIKAPLVTGSTALTLPFFTVGTTDNDTDGITAAHGSCATAVIDTVRRLQVTIDVDGQTSRDFAVTGATESDSVADFTNTLTGLSLSFTDGIHSCRVASIATATISDTSSASRDGSTTTVKVQYDGVNLTSTHGLTVGANVTIANATYSGTGGSAAVNTVQTITAISTTGSTANDTLSFTVDGLDAAVSGTGVTTTFNNTVTLTITDYVCGNDTFSGGSVVVKTPSLNDGVVNEIYGSCVFSDPNDNSESYIILAANSKAVAVKISDPSTTYDLAYPTGQTVSDSVEMTQAFNKLLIFRDGDTPFEKDLSATNINTSPQLDKVESGTYTQPIPISVTDLDIASGVATATVGSTATLKRGDIFTITVTNSTIEAGTVATVDDLGDSSGSNTSTKFRFITNVADQTNKTATIEKPMSEGVGFSHMPAPAYGVYHQRRLAVPFRHSVDASDDSYTDRKIFDEIIISDIVDTDTYDQIFGQFRFNAGKSDFNVGMLSFSDDKLIVFNRNSIHLVDGTENLSIASAKLLTDEVGLVARNSAVQVGNQILFLSDNGVYGLNFIDLYNLRGNEVPLSESIQKTIDTINKAHADKASAVYFDNKYYLAVPTGSSTVNNTLLIYNFLNNSWESIDSVNNKDLSGTEFSSFEFTKLLVTGKGLDKGVYVTNTDGGIHKLEVWGDGIDRVITDIGETTETETRVQGSATTRMFTLKSIDRKKFNNFELHLQSGPDNSSDVSIAANTENLDSKVTDADGNLVDGAIDLKKASDYIGGVIAPDEDVSIRGRIGNKRAYGLQVTLTSILGRPRFRSLKIAGAETFRSTSSVQ